MKIKDTAITVSDIEVYARHGVLDQEKKVGNRFLVTVTLTYDATCAMKYDDLEHSVDYAKVIGVVRDVMSESSGLIEHVAWNIIGALSETFPAVTGGSVSVTKVHPPVSQPVSGATFSATFTR